MRILVSIVLLLLVAFSAHAEERHPVPDKAAQDSANKLVLEIYGEEISQSKKSADKIAISRKLLEEAGLVAAACNSAAPTTMR